MEYTDEQKKEVVEQFGNFVEENIKEVVENYQAENETKKED